MNLLARYESSKNASHPCAVTRLFGSEQARISAEDWLQELVDVDGLPTSARDWRLITLNATTRIASRVQTSSLAAEPQIA
jgi:hypothetical protein